MKQLQLSLASGINPKNSIIFNQSGVTAHSEAAWILSCVARTGWLSRMTQFKEKSWERQRKGQCRIIFLSCFNGCRHITL